ERADVWRAGGVSPRSGGEQAIVAQQRRQGGQANAAGGGGEEVTTTAEGMFLGGAHGGRVSASQGGIRLNLSVVPVFVAGRNSGLETKTISLTGRLRRRSCRGSLCSARR